MPHRTSAELEEEDPGQGGGPRKLAVYTEAAAFYVACLRAGYADEATEFAEWFLDSFDIDLEE